MSAADFGLRNGYRGTGIQFRAGDGVEATVRDIGSAPSLRRQATLAREREAAKRAHPAFRMRELRAAGHSGPVPVSHLTGFTASGNVSDRRLTRSAFAAVRFVLAFVFVVAVGSVAGMQLQSASYAGPTWSHSVATGESVWALADRVGSPRPLHEVVEDIRVLNALSSDLLVPGQILTLPVE